MAGTAQYTNAQIMWILAQVAIYNVKETHIILAGFKAKFGRPLLKNQFRYVKNKYGKDPKFNCMLLTRNAKLLVDEDAEMVPSPVIASVKDEAMRDVKDKIRVLSLPQIEKMDLDDSADEESSGDSSPVAESTNYTTDRSLAAAAARQYTRNHPEAPVPLPGYYPRHSAVHMASRMPRAYRRAHLARAMDWRQAPPQRQAHLQQMLQMQEFSRQQQQLQAQQQLQYPLHSQSTPFWPQAQFNAPMGHVQGHRQPFPFMGGQANMAYEPYACQKLPETEWPQPTLDGHSQGFVTQQWLQSQNLLGMDLQTAQTPEFAAASRPSVAPEYGVEDPVEVEAAEAAETEAQPEESSGELVNDSSSDEPQLTPLTEDEMIFGFSQDPLADDFELLSPLRDDIYRGEASIEAGVSNGDDAATADLEQSLMDDISGNEMLDFRLDDWLAVEDS